MDILLIIYIFFVLLFVGSVQDRILLKFRGIVLRKDTGTPVLEDFQKTHVSKLVKILAKWVAYQDHSTTGCGKTFTTMEIARRLGYKVLIICPSGELMDKWRDVASLFNVEVLDVISYTSLAGRKNSELSHDYLVREDEGNKPVFRPTNILDDAIKAGLFVVFDESHRTKNKGSARSIACQSLVKRVIAFNNTGKYSPRIAILSASPGNELDHIIPLIYLLGFITEINIYKWNIGTQELELPGYSQLIRNCRKFLCKSKEDKEAMREILDNVKTNKKKHVMEAIGELYHCFIKQRVGNAMIRPRTEFFPDYHTCFYNLTKSEADNLSAAITKLSTLIVHKNGDNGMAAGKMGEFQTTLVEIEKAKLPMVARQVKKELTIINRKVLVYVNNLASIDYLMRELEDIEDSVREMSGRMKKSEIKETISKFQENNNDVRVILCTIGTGSEGIDLDDKFGTHPRTLFLMPRYKFLEEYQSTGRVYRGKYTKSKSMVRFMYGNGDNAIENRILDSITRKTKYSKYFLTAEGDRVPFPGDYDKYEENEEGELVKKVEEVEEEEEE